MKHLIILFLVAINVLLNYYDCTFNLAIQAVIAMYMV